MELDEREAAHYAGLWARIDHPSAPPEIDLDGYAPHRLVRWLMANRLVIFHGSNRLDLDELSPIRKSMELADTAGRGNLGAVYGTHDGLWSMFFAVVDRARLVGSIRNGVDSHRSVGGDELDLYHFSLHHESLSQRPFTTGAVYLLPRLRFERLPLYPGGPASHEWACDGPVRPLARLIVRPEDCPFLDQIGGHDDTELIDFGRLADSVYDEAVSARLIEGGIEIATICDGATVDGLVEASRRFYPDVVCTPADQPLGTLLTMTGPAAFQQAMATRFGHLLDASDQPPA